MSLTRLDAINNILTHAGENPVVTLADSGTNDVDLAETALDSSIKQILSYGLGFNTETKTFARNSDNKIPMSSNILHFTPAGEDTHRKLVKRGNFLYDKDENTFEFEEDVDLSVTYNWDFDEMPIDAQWWIIYHAARVYQMQTQRSRESDAYLAEKEAMAKARAMQTDLRNRNSNYIQNFANNIGWIGTRNRRWRRGIRYE